MLLRAAIAAKQGGHKTLATVYRRQLVARFQAQHLRGSRLHEREEALFQLVVEGNAKQALALAVANWEVQKEPEDARILLHAALAANDADGVATIVHWLETTGMQDIRLQSLLRQRHSISM